MRVQLCTTCGHVNDLDAEFCELCGSFLEWVGRILDVVCRTCGTRNPGGAEFCSSCSAVLEVSGTVAQPGTVAQDDASAVDDAPPTAPSTWGASPEPVSAPEARALDALTAARTPSPPPPAGQGRASSPDPRKRRVGPTLSRRPRLATRPGTGRTVAVVPVWFATNRATASGRVPRRAFANRTEPTGTVHHGVASVEIPDTHRFGSTGTPAWKRWMRFEFRSDRLVVADVRNFASGHEFHDELGKFAATLTKRSALVYIHGYNVSFGDCVVRAAQMSYDLNHTGVTAAFTWPSRARTRCYLIDRERVEGSEGALAEYLRGLVTAGHLEEVHIIAHSMGNRGLTRALQRIAPELEQAGATYGQIILAAPDIDVELFKQLAVIYPTIAERTTLYASGRDRALRMSKYLQDSDRAGFFPPITTVDGIDTIEVSNADVTRFDLGHGVYAECDALLYDIGHLLRHSAPPSERQRLSAMSTDGGNRYWVLRR